MSLDAITLDVEQSAEQRRYSSVLLWERGPSLYGLNTWQKEAIKGLYGLEQLQWNWDGYNSTPPSPVAVAIAQKLIYRDTPELPIPNIVPVSGGGIQIEWNTIPRGLQVEVLPTGYVLYLKTGSGEPIEENALHNISQFDSLLTWLAA